MPPWWGRRKPSPTGLAQLKKEEGWRSTPYLDTRGVGTFGYGFTYLDRSDGDRIIERILRDTYIPLAQDYIGPGFENLSEPRQWVLIGMAYQMGAGIRSFKLTRKAILRGDYGKAADLMLESLWAKQTPNRAYRMSRQMRTGEWQS